MNHLSFRPGTQYRDFTSDQVMQANPVVTPSSVIRTNDFWAVNGFDENVLFFAVEDWDFWMRLSRRGLIRVLRDPLVGYRIPFSKKRDARQIGINSLEVIRKNSGVGRLFP